MLIPIDIKLLPEVALLVEQPHCDQGNPEAAGTFNMVTRQHPKTTGVDRGRLVNPKLSREIDHRF